MGRAIPSIIIVLICLLLLFPIVWMILGSFKPLERLYHDNPFIMFSEPSIESYKRIFAYPILRWFGNSIFLCIVGPLFAMTMTVPAAYAFAKKNIPMKETIFVAMLAVIAVPAIFTAAPRMILIRLMGLKGSLWGIIIPASTNPVWVFLLRQYLLDVPKGLLDTAEIDGASEWQKFTKIVVPLCIPPIAVMLVIDVITCWNSFLWPFAVLGYGKTKTLITGISWVVLTQTNNLTHGIPGGHAIGVQMAGATLLFVPALIWFLSMQKHYKTNILSGGLK